MSVKLTLYKLFPVKKLSQICVRNKAYWSVFPIGSGRTVKGTRWVRDDMRYKLYVMDSNLCSTCAMRPAPAHMHQYLARRKACSIGTFERQWTLTNDNVLICDGIDTNKLRVAERVHASIEHIVCSRFNDCLGPLTLMLGMSSIIRAHSKLHYVIIRLGIVTSYEIFDMIRQRLI